MTEGWMQIITLIIANFTVIWWFRKESREDWKMIHQDLKEFKDVVRIEMKDFHERLVEIEKNRSK